jgi:hypothetical protein
VGNALLIFSDALPAFLGAAILLITVALALRLRGSAPNTPVYVPVNVSGED